MKCSIGCCGRKLVRVEKGKGGFLSLVVAHTSGLFQVSGRIYRSFLLFFESQGPPQVGVILVRVSARQVLSLPLHDARGLLVRTGSRLKCSLDALAIIRGSYWRQVVGARRGDS